MELHPKVLNQYNQTRSGTYKKIVCHAPFVSLNFEQNGNVRACCYNTKDILGKWPEQSIREIWQGENANRLRSLIRQNDLGGGLYRMRQYADCWKLSGCKGQVF